MTSGVREVPPMPDGTSGSKQRPRRFKDRREAGRLLAGRLASFARPGEVVVLGLPRGGIPVAYEVALGLGAPLDAFTVRKLGVPDYPELAMGAVASGGAQVWNRDVIEALGISREVLERVATSELRELERRERFYRENRSTPEVAGKTVILVDDGLATGASMLAGIRALREKQPARIVVAVPVASAESCAMLRERADDVVSYAIPAVFGGVGEWYEDFSQVSDEVVRSLLDRAALRRFA